MLGTVQTAVYLPLLYDYIVDVDRDGKIDPNRSLAESWRLGPDSKYYEFSIRRGIKFSNGEELNAEDVKFSIERLMGKASIASRSVYFRSTIDRIELVDPYTLRIYLKTAGIFLPLYFSPLTQGIEGLVLPKDYVTSKGDDYFRNNPVGSGVLTFGGQKRGDFLRLYAAEGKHWRGGVARYEQVLFRLIPEQQTRDALLKTDAVDIITASTKAAKELESQGYKAYVKPRVLNVYCEFGERWHGPFADVKVREALNLAIDREAINKSLLAGTAEVMADYILGPEDTAYVPQPIYPYDPARARALLKESEYPKPQVTMYTYSMGGFSELPLIAEAVASMWQAVGADVKLQAMDYVTYRTSKPKEALGPGSAGCISSGEFPIAVKSPYGATYTRNPDHQDQVLVKLLASIPAAPDTESYITAARETAKYMRDTHLNIPVVRAGFTFATGPAIKEWHFTKIGQTWDILTLVERGQ